MQKIFPPGYMPLPDNNDAPPVAVLEPAPEPKPEFTDEQIEQSMPHPVGHKILLAMPEIDDRHENSILYKAESTKHAEHVTSVVALVVELGPDAYQDPVRYPSGPWCKEGDYVLIGPYKGQRFFACGKEYRIITDDLVEGIVADPRGYRRI